MKREAESALASVMKPMKREDVTDLIVFRKMKSGLKWPEIAKKVGASKEWTAAACLGQMQMTRKQAEADANSHSLGGWAITGCGLITRSTTSLWGEMPSTNPGAALLWYCR